MKFSVNKFFIQLAKSEMSVIQLIELTGMSQKTISNVKCGKQKPNPRTIGKFAKAFNCSVEELLED